MARLDSPYQTYIKINQPRTCEEDNPPHKMITLMMTQPETKAVLRKYVIDNPFPDDEYVCVETKTSSKNSHCPPQIPTPDKGYLNIYVTTEGEPPSSTLPL